MSATQQRLKKLEFLIKQSWEKVKEDPKDKFEYEQEWNRFFEYVHEYRILHGFQNPERYTDFVMEWVNQQKKEYISQKVNGK
jgi:hypothetical protein